MCRRFRRSPIGAGLQHLSTMVGFSKKKFKNLKKKKGKKKKALDWQFQMNNGGATQESSVVEFYMNVW